MTWRSDNREKRKQWKLQRATDSELQGQQAKLASFATRASLETVNILKNDKIKSNYSNKSSGVVGNATFAAHLFEETITVQLAIETEWGKPTMINMLPHADHQLITR